MSYHPYIERQSYLSPKLWLIEAPFKPIIYGYRHLKKIFNEDPTIVKLEHFALAALQIGTILEAVEHYYKYQQIVPAALLLTIAICATVFDLYIQNPATAQLAIESAETQTIESSCFALLHKEMILAPPIFNEIGLFRTTTLKPEPSDFVCNKAKIEIKNKEVGQPILSISNIPAELSAKTISKQTCFRYYVYGSICLVEIFQKNLFPKQIGPSYWIQTDTQFNLMQFQKWEKINNNNEFKLLKSTVEETQFTLPNQVFIPPDLGQTAFPQQIYSPKPDNNDIVHTDKQIKLTAKKNNHYTISIPILIDPEVSHQTIYFTSENIYVKQSAPNKPTRWISTKIPNKLVQYNSWEKQPESKSYIIYKVSKCD